MMTSPLNATGSNLKDCPHGFELHGEYCFNFAMETAHNGVIYSEAEDYCAAQGFTLAYPTITDLKEWQISVSDAIPANFGYYAWVGPISSQIRMGHGPGWT